MNKSEQILQSIKKYNKSYRAGTPQISDLEYDNLVERLRRIDPDNEWFKRIEPVYVAYDRKVKLPIPMKSLNKAKTQQELQNWAKSVGMASSSVVIITPKFDGLSLLHDEKSGMAYSRGGAENEGQDCTPHYKAATSIVNTPNRLSFTYGEFVFSNKSWTTNFAGKTSPDTGDKYKSPRNTAAGFLNRNELTNNLQYVDFFRYGTDDGSLDNFTTYEDLFNYLCDTFSQPKLYQAASIEELTAERCQELYQTWSKQYYIDGLVIYANDLKVWRVVGRQKNTGNPNYAIAYKDPNFTDIFETTVKNIIWKVNKSGALKPVVNIKTVDTGGCSMENPTGHNAKWIREHHIAKGARVLVTRSGCVIPKILKTLETPAAGTENELWNNLQHCPHCGSLTKWNESGVELMCGNPNCNGVQLAKIVFFFKILEVEHIGEETLSKIYNAGYTRLREILGITFDELLDIDGFGEVNTNQFLSSINKIKSGVEVTKLMHASNCFHNIGQATAKAILSQMSEEDLYAFYAGQFHTWKNNEELQTKSFFINGNIKLKCFALGLIPFYDFLAENGLKVLPMKEEIKATGSSCAGFKVCFTGIRDSEMENKIKANGGEIANGVSKKTTHLIVLGKDSQSAKAIKAKQLGIPIMTIDEFKKSYAM